MTRWAWRETRSAHRQNCGCDARRGPIRSDIDRAGGTGHACHKVSDPVPSVRVDPLPDSEEDPVLIDCTTCVARDIACTDCVITVLMHSPPARPHRSERADPPATGASEQVALDAPEQVALGALARAGLVPPLRLVRPLGKLSDTA